MAKLHNLAATTAIMSVGLFGVANAGQALNPASSFPYQEHLPAVTASATDQNSNFSSEPGAAPLQLAEKYIGLDEAAPRKLVEVKSENGIRYASGGVGETERDALNALSDQFNLRLIFAMADNGAYLARVQVDVMNASGEKVISAISEGPWFFAQLEPGEYTVDVKVVGDQDQVAGHPQPKKVQVNGSEQSVVRFLWS